MSEYLIIKKSAMSIKRKLVKIETPKPQGGFLGSSHTARAVITAGFSASDPSIMLMDDYLVQKLLVVINLFFVVIKPYLFCS